MLNVESIYVHVPFCRGKCPYCSFYSVLYAEECCELYLQSLSSELDCAVNSGLIMSPGTLYVGGGTPSILSVMQFRRLLDLLKLKINLQNCAEWTIEANPDSLTDEKIQVARDAGVSRISMGVQALGDSGLSGLGRNYSIDDVERRIASVVNVGIRDVGIDLIAGLPGVTRDKWQQTLKWAGALNVWHVAVYALSIEKNCKWASEHIKASDDDVIIPLLDMAEESLVARGFRRYEISNYALPGHECFHNLQFWRGGDYLGFGPSASSRLGFDRFTNIADLDRYNQLLGNRRSPVVEKEHLTGPQDSGERLAFALRLAEGIDIDEFGARIGAAASERISEWNKTLCRLMEENLVLKKGGRWFLTPRGRCFADSVAAALL